MDNQKIKIRSMTSNIYDVQKLRIQCGNRLVASFKDLAETSRNRTAESVKTANEEKTKKIRAKLTKENPDMTENELNDAVIEAMKAEADRDEQKTLSIIMGEYARVTDILTAEFKQSTAARQVEKAIEKASQTGEPLAFIGSVYDFQMAKQYDDLLKLEESANKALESEVKKHPLWDAFFKDVKGCGPLMAAVCISYFDVYTARHASSFWRYAGLDVVENVEGKAEGRSRKHRVEQTYIDKDGKERTKMGLGYNPTLKTKLVGVLGSCMLKSGIRTDKETGMKVYSGYAKAYGDYKKRLDNRPDTAEYSSLRKHRMANRYMVKQFVRDLWVVWRRLEGLEVTEPYEVAFLGRHHHGYNDAVDKVNK